MIAIGSDHGGFALKQTLMAHLEKRGLARVLMQENMTADTLTAAIRKTWEDREELISALRNAPPADGTNRVFEMIQEIQK